jgi:uncharacterized SAM-binding protein YcdF (DUF218 family)
MFANEKGSMAVFSDQKHTDLRKGAAMVRSPFAGVTGAFSVLRHGLSLLRRVAVIGLLAGSLLLAVGFIVFANGIERHETSLTPQADGIVVLTGGGERIGDGIRLLAQGAGKRLLISGVNTQTRPAEVARNSPDRQHLFSCCIDLGYRAINTIGNAIEARDWARQHGFKRLAIVTSAYHMPRTLGEFAAVLPDATLIAHPVVSEEFEAGPWWKDLHQTRILMIEYVKHVASIPRRMLEPSPGAWSLRPVLHATRQAVKS